MNTTWTARLLCLAAVLGLIFAIGCQVPDNAFSAQRRRRRAYVVRTDLDHAVDDVDWILGYDHPTKMYDETMR